MWSVVTRRLARYTCHAMDRPDRRLSTQEYLALEASSPERLEYRDGLAVALAEPTANHEFISGNLVVALGPPARSNGCVFLAAGGKVVTSRGDRLIPDFLITCDPRDRAALAGPRGEAIVRHPLARDRNSLAIDRTRRCHRQAGRLSIDFAAHALRRDLLAPQGDAYICARPGRQLRDSCTSGPADAPDARRAWPFDGRDISRHGRSASPQHLSGDLGAHSEAYILNFKGDGYGMRSTLPITHRS